MRIHALALLSAAAIAAPTTASAATTINGTLAGALFGITSSTATIGAGSVFNNIFTFVSDARDQFDTVGLSTPISLSAVTATKGSAVNFTSAFGSYTGLVDTVAATSGSGSRTVTLASLGSFTPTGSLSSYTPGAASVTFSFTQTGGPGSSVSGSFSLASPPISSPVPEPGVWVMMLSGAGFVGLAARRRRKKPSTDA